MPNFVEIRLVTSDLMDGHEFINKASTSRKGRIITVIIFVAVPLRFPCTENAQFLCHLAQARVLPSL